VFFLFLPHVLCPASEAPYFKFLCVDGFAALISVPIWTYFGFWGERELSSFDLLEGYVKKGQAGIFMVFGIVFAISLFVWIVKKKFLKRSKIPQTEAPYPKQANKH
jgi:membrane protein DedA with SNARE-associated domain